MSAEKTKQQWGITPPISLAMPNEKEVSINQDLIEELKRQGSFESSAETAMRMQVLSRLQAITEDFVKMVCRKKNYPDSVVKTAGGKIFTFGSYRLGVYGPGSDIDTLVVGPNSVTRQDFFDHIPAILQALPEVKEVSAVHDAFVPIIKFKFSGISIDLIYARLNQASVTKDLTLMDNNLLRGMDETNLRCLNGTRVTDEILQLVPKPQVFKGALRAIKLWAQRRAIYANVMGFPGGVAWAMLVARICQLYPNAVSAVIVSKFFRILAQWNWPQPVMLKAIEEGPLSVRVWNPRIYPGDRHHLMPIITPAYPSMCATHNITPSTKEIITRELKRAADMLDKVFAGTETWSNIFVKHSFFTTGYKYYLSVIAASKNADQQLAWSGLVESKLRQLVMKLETIECIALAHPFNKGFENEHEVETEEEGQQISRGAFLKGGVKKQAPASEVPEAKDESEKAEESKSPEEQKKISIHTTTYYVGLELKLGNVEQTRKVDVSWPTEEFYNICRNWPQFDEDQHSVTVIMLRNFELPDQVFSEGEVKPVKPARKKKVVGAKRTLDAAGIDEDASMPRKRTSAEQSVNA